MDEKEKIQDPFENETWVSVHWQPLKTPESKIEFLNTNKDWQTIKTYLVKTMSPSIVKHLFDTALAHERKQTIDKIVPSSRAWKLIYPSAGALCRSVQETPTEDDFPRMERLSIMEVQKQYGHFPQYGQWISDRQQKSTIIIVSHDFLPEKTSEIHLNMTVSLSVWT